MNIFEFFNNNQIIYAKGSPPPFPSDTFWKKILADFFSALWAEISFTNATPPTTHTHKHRISIREKITCYIYF